MMTLRGTGYRRRRWTFVCCLVVLSLFWLPGTAAAAKLVKVWGAPEAAIQALRASQPGMQWLSEVDTGASEAVQLHVAWQQDAYQRALASGSRAPVLVLSRQAVVARLRSQDSVLSWGPPLAQQVQLVRRLMPLAKRIGILHRESMRADYERLLESTVANGAGVSLVSLIVEAPLTARIIAEAAEQVDVLIASNDDSLFNRDSAKLVLLTAYRHQRAVIGPTPAFVSAGAVATQAVPKSALIAAIVARVSRWQESGHLSDTQSSMRFAPVINIQVARSLGIFIASDLLREVQP